MNALQWIASAFCIALTSIAVSTRLGLGERNRIFLTLPLGLSVGIGVWGACSIAGLFAPAHRDIVNILFIVAIAAISGIWLLLQPTPPDKKPLPSLDSKWDFLTFAFIAVAILATTAFIIESLRHPDGDWDAWTLWTVRARFLFRGHGGLKLACTPLLPHTDYPPLLAAVIDRVWRMMGKEAACVPATVAGGFAALTVAVLVSTVASLRGRRWGLLSGMILLGTPQFLKHSEEQMADVPISLFFLCACSLLILAQIEWRAGGSTLALAGVTAASAALTKNEGQLQFFALASSLLVFPPLVSLDLNDINSSQSTNRIRRNLPADSMTKGDLRRRDLAGGTMRRCRAMAWFVGGALPMLALLAYFKMRYAPSNDLVAGTPAGMVLSRIENPHRYGVIARGLGRSLLRLDWWNLFLVALIAIWLVALWNRKIPAELRGTVLTIGLTLVGYGFVYVLTPHDLAWHVSSSLDRLIIQLWPAGVLVTTLLITPRR